ncbi:MAG: GTPase HflX [Parvularculaceae bacterium]|nr:GTPase HflX [Parvularculaceae bacterium]
MTDKFDDDGAPDFGAAFVIHVDFDGVERRRSSSARLEEAVGLAQAIDLNVVFAEVANISDPRPATLLGRGRVQAIEDRLNGTEPRPGLVIVDTALSPVQHRNLENAWRTKVLDRTALILEIFGERAQTAEGRLQVDLAHLTYQKSRLVRSWTHLERQRGGRGFLGGPGERQIESDRRAIQVRIDRLREKLDQVRRTRTLQREKRRKTPHPVVALVGYTNAGKSTLFNLLSRAAVVARDQLFATLDPTMRAIDLPSGQRVILSDTVGFISDLPTQLVAAFRATLEEVNEADLILHVRDIAHEDTEAQREDVLKVLAELGVEPQGDRRFVEVLNKIDILPAEDRKALEATARLTREKNAGTIEEPFKAAVSAITGEGVDELRAFIDELLTLDRETFRVTLNAGDGAARAWLHAHGEVLAEAAEDGLVAIDVRITRKSEGQFKKQFPGAAIILRVADRGRLSA